MRDKRPYRRVVVTHFEKVSHYPSGKALEVAIETLYIGRMFAF